MNMKNRETQYHRLDKPMQARCGGTNNKNVMIK